jgi:hypothetical protein
MLATVSMLTLTAGCAGTGRDTWAGRGKPVTFANEPQPSPTSGRLVTGIGGLRVALEERVISSAGMVRPVASDCDTVVIASEFTCRVTYQGETVTYHVTTQPDSGSAYTWQAQADQLVATKAGIEAAMWRAYATRATAMSCDTTLPDRKLVAPRSTLQQRCYFKPTLKDPAFGQNSGNKARTVAVTISINDGSLSLHETTQ